jgi:hypothetical protein
MSYFPRRPSRLAVHRPGQYFCPQGALIEGLEQRICLSALSFLPPAFHPGTTNIGSKVAIGDFNNDGKPDLAVSSFTSVFILLNKGGGAFADPTENDMNALTDAIAVGDFNHDGFNDVAVDLEYGLVVILLGKGDGTFADNRLSADDGGESLHHSIAVGDFNADGWPDLAMTSADSNALSVSINQRNGTFGYAHYNAGINPTSVVFDDYDRDHGWDLAVTSAGARGTGLVSVLLDNTRTDPTDPQNQIPDGTFGPATPFAVGFAPVAVAAGFPDFNSDGFDDLAVANSLSAVNVLAGDGGGGFDPATSTQFSGNPTAIAVSDFTGSGHIDLAVLVGTNVEIALGNGNGTFQSPVAFPIGGDNQSSIAIADLNGDGKPDIVVTLDATLSVLLAGTPPTGSISGSVFNDANSNGALDTGEKGQPNVRVYLDSNKNGIFDSGTETGVLTNASGNYTFTKLPPDTYTIREELPPGQRMTLPTLGSYNVTLAPNQLITKKSFGNTTHPLLKGTIFNDLNSDGLHQLTENGLAGWTVFIDTNKNGLLDFNEPHTLTDASGNYVFGTVSAGAYRVREVLKSGFRRTSPAAGYYDVTLTAASVTAFKSFGDTSNVLISGAVFNDANGNKLRDKSNNILESGLANWRIYIDANNNGIFDKGELSTLSDASGNWAFKTLHARSAAYIIRIASQAGWTRTTPGGGKPPGSLSVMLTTAGTSKTGLLFGEKHL